MQSVGRNTLQVLCWVLKACWFSWCWMRRTWCWTPSSWTTVTGTPTGSSRQPSLSKVNWETNFKEVTFWKSIREDIAEEWKPIKTYTVAFNIICSRIAIENFLQFTNKLKAFKFKIRALGVSKYYIIKFCKIHWAVRGCT